MFSKRVIEEIKNLKDSQLLDLAKECYSYNGTCDWADVFGNDEFFFKDMFDDAYDAVRAVYFGEYNFHDDYVRFDAYGNLETLTDYQLEKEARDFVDDIIDALEDNPHAESLLNDLGIYLDDEE